MNETGKRKEWIKTIAIIFLAILLVLTFFSNTIKNYSLPEVAAQYTYSGSITNKVRGTATVEASDPYSVIFKADRKVESVSVRVGDEVKKGEVLYVLEEGESEELKEARKTLETLQNAYDKGLVLGQISKELAGKVENGSIGSASEMQDKVTAAKKKVDNAKAYLEGLQKEQSTNTNKPNSADEEIQKSIDNMNKNIIPGIDEKIDTYTKSLGKANEAYIEIVKADIDILGKVVNVYKYTLIMLDHFAKNANVYTISEERNELDTVKYSISNSPNSVDSMKKAIDLVKRLCDKYDSNLLNSQNGGNPAIDYSLAESLSYNYTDCITNNSVLKQQESAIADYTKKLSDENQNLINCNNQITIWKGQLTGTTPNDDLAVKIINAQASLEKAEKAYNDLVAEINTSFDLLDQIEQIKAQKDTIAKLEKEQGSAEITAPVSGTVLSMAYSAGETIKQGDTVSTIQIAGKGYTMSVSIPNDKVRYIAVGDEAEITNSWWYSDVHARIATIRPDPSNPAQNKLVTFELEGDVTSGQSLSFSVGKKSANYENIVPNSAIHEDNKGKFIYKINAKSTPLGNRYIIERIDVTVVASDDTQSAVTGALEGWDYIATTASKPIEDGTEVRLKD